MAIGDYVSHNDLDAMVRMQMGATINAPKSAPPNWKPPGKMLTVAACEVGGFVVFDTVSGGAAAPLAAFTTIQEALDFVQNKMLLSV